MFKIRSKKALAEGTLRMDIEAPRIARKAQPGQFIILRPDAEGERIPLTIADYDRDAGTVSIIFQVVGASTRKLAALEAGAYLADFVGPLGNPSAEHTKTARRVLCIGGGVGTAVVYPQVKALHEAGVAVDVITGARSEALLILREELEAQADALYIATDDGTAGRHGFVTDILKERLEAGEAYDVIVAIGPVPMMRAVCAVTKPYGVKTIVSLNPIMVDGTGMCGGCRVRVGGEYKYACVDGPDFDGQAVDFEELSARNAFYRDFEREADHRCKGGLFDAKG